MASSIGDKFYEKYLKCGICLDAYRSPRGLPCLHSFCEECLGRWAKKSDKPGFLTCPNCMKETPIPQGGVTEFPADFRVNSLQADTGNQTQKDGAASKPRTQDRYCTEHEGEEKRYYCETCGKPVCRDCIVMKQCCRDHDYVTLKQASDKQVTHIKESIKTCREKKTVCQNALKRLAEHTDKLRTVMNQIDSTVELGVNLTESGSPFDIVSKYTSVLSSLQKVNDIHVNEVDDVVSVIPTPGKQWEETGRFKVPCNTDWGLPGIAAAADGNIALREGSKAHIYSRSGDFKHTFPTKGYTVGDVSITPSNVYVIPTTSKSCQLYNSQCKLILEFQTRNANNEPYVARAVTVDRYGCIILGLRDEAISIHNPDGSVKSSFAIPYKPLSVAVTSRQEIVVATRNDTLELLDYSGKSILTLAPPPSVKTWSPWHVCCSKRDEVFVVNHGDPKAIYKYAAGRVYMGCITTEVNQPGGIALSHDDKELYVTEYSDKMVKIFKRP